MTKICCLCKLSKDEICFNKNRTRKDGLQAQCKDCSHKKTQEYYKNNREKHIEHVTNKHKEKMGLLKYKRKCTLCNEKNGEEEFRSPWAKQCNTCYKQTQTRRWKRNREKQMKERTQLIAQHKRECCACLENDMDCLDFHHIRDKKFNISSKLRGNKTDLIEEIQKCIVFCANCHRKYHKKRFCLLIDKAA